MFPSDTVIVPPRRISGLKLPESAATTVILPDTVPLNHVFASEQMSLQSEGSVYVPAVFSPAISGRSVTYCPICGSHTSEKELVLLPRFTVTVPFELNTIWNPFVSTPPTEGNELPCAAPFKYTRVGGR